MPTLRAHILGRFQLSVGDRPIDGLRTRKSRSLLAFLMLNADRAYSREILADTIWGEAHAGDPLKALRQELWTIRSAFRQR